MTYKEAILASINVEWVVGQCSSTIGCWCAPILPVKPISYEYSSGGSGGSGGGEIFTEELTHIVGEGSISKEYAQHIVDIHNQFLNTKNK